MFQTKNIVNFLTNNFNLSEDIELELKRHYRYNKQEKVWEIIQENMQDFVIKMKRSCIDEKLKVSIERCLKLKIPEFFD